MKTITRTLAILAILLTACTKTAVRDSVEIAYVSGSEFPGEGGIGSIETLTDGIPVEAVTNEPEWIELSTVRQTVLFRILPNRSGKARSGTVSISAGELKGASVQISQNSWRGLSLSTRTVDFSMDTREVKIQVYCSSEYEAEFTENPDGCFSFEKQPDGILVKTSKGPGINEHKGRLLVKPADTQLEAQVISILLPQKSVFDFVVGTWTVERNNEEGSAADYSDFIFIKEKDQQTFSVSISKAELAGGSFTAEMTEDGRVRIWSGQECGYNSDEGKYMSLHYNGTKNGGGWYIFNTAKTVAWDAEPQFDYEAGIMRMEFSDSATSNENKAEQLNFWLCPGSYFNFYGAGAHAVATYKELVLTRELTEEL